MGSYSKSPRQAAKKATLARKQARQTKPANQDDQRKSDRLAEAEEMGELRFN